MSTPLTIAVPTHNRARLLAGTLASIAALKFPEGIIPECLIIDNNSPDDTRDAVEVFARNAPIAVRYVIEPQLGSSYARNRAIAEARGEYVFFIDDDAIADPDWAIELLAEMERRHLDAACGLVLPNWERPPPRWLGPSLYVRLAVHDEATIAAASPPQRDHIHNYFSANVGFRRETFRLFGNFREDLGVVGDNPISGEDTELFARIATCGGAIGFASRARVHHVIGRERMTRRYLRRKAYRIRLWQRDRRRSHAQSSGQARAQRSADAGGRHPRQRGACGLSRTGMREFLRLLARPPRLAPLN